MKYIHNSREFRERRQNLRKNATPQEIRLWFHLKSQRLGYRFYRQHSIGPYIVDFYCPQKRLVIELDGLQHSEVEARQYDRERTNYLLHLNHIVVRFWNDEIDTNIEEAILKIRKVLDSSPNSNTVSSPLP